MNALRQELSLLLDQAGSGRRPPALRRSRREDALYATDLPAVSPGEAESFMRAARDAGWRAEERDGWIELDRIPDSPPDGWQPGDAGAETACCLSLLRRRRRTEPEQEPEAREAAALAIRKLLKAGEAGGDGWEKVCAGLHREWAIRLREGKGIPPVPEEFLTL